MTGGVAPRLRLFLAAGLLLPLLALLVWTPTPASAAIDSISAVVQVCTLPFGPSCDPTQPINGADWASSATVNGSEVWWRVVVKNTGTDPLTNIKVTSSLPSSTSDCEGPVPVSTTGTLAAGASYGYECVTTNVTLPATVMQTVQAFGDPPSGPTVASTSSTATANVQPLHGYWMVASDGGIFSYGVPFLGSTGGMALNKPIVGMAAMPAGDGYYLVASDGGIFNYGSAQFYGSMGGKPLNKPIVGMAVTGDGGGYWLVASDGGIFSFGDAQFYGSTGSLTLNKPIVGMATTPNGLGYYLVASDGGIFNYGNAAFEGSAGSLVLNKPVVGMSVPVSGGYYLVASDGGTFSYPSTLPFYGSTGSITLNKPVVGMAAVAGGYYFVAADGGIFAYPSTLPFLGSHGGQPLNAPIVGMSAY